MLNFRVAHYLSLAQARVTRLSEDDPLAQARPSSLSEFLYGIVDDSSVLIIGSYNK